MKSMKKLVLVGLVLLASVMVLAGCDTNAGDSSSGADAPTQQPTGDGSGKTETPKFTVTFETDHGTAPKDLVVESGTKLTAEQLPSLADTDDYIFEGWQVKGTTTLVQAGFEVTKDVTLVAKWRDRDTTGSVSFDPPDGTKFFYDEPVTVTLATTEEASIKYKLGEGEWQDYSGPIEILSQNTITAYAIKEGLKDSEKTSATYTVRELTSISITPPTRTVYSVGEKFDPTGMVVKAKYDDDEERTVEGTITSDTSTLTNAKGIKRVTVSYSEGAIPQSTAFDVVVFPEEVKVLTDYESPNNTDDTWTYVAFGEWPQSEAKDFTPTTQAISYGIFKENYYEEDDGKYVKVDGKYFKVEPIVWRVLNKNYSGTGKALLLAEKILTGGIEWDDNKNNYMESNIRKWLNGNSGSGEQSDYGGDVGFLQTAFTPDVHNLIANTIVDNSARSTTDAEQNLDEATKYICKDTEDKIFLLSEQEATIAEYGFAAYDTWVEGNTRIRVTTDYAQITGAYQDGTAGCGGWWWLRSPNYHSESVACIINTDGFATYSSIVEDASVGVVPALYIELQ